MYGAKCTWWWKFVRRILNLFLKINYRLVIVLDNIIIYQVILLFKNIFYN